VRRERRARADTVLQLDVLRYDARGKITRAVTGSRARSQGDLTTSVAYTGLGAVVASQVQRGITWNLEEFRPDGLGNVRYQRTRYAEDQTRPGAWSHYTGTGLLDARSGVFPADCPTGTIHIDTLYQAADGAGNVSRSGEHRRSGCDNNAGNFQTVTNSYYSADHRLAVVQRNSDQAGTAPSWEEYWYDALGRRVLTRSRHQIPTCYYPLRCADFVERTVWDGDQLLAEQRSSWLDVIGGGAPDFGTVRYVHLLGIDQPVAVLDSRFPARVLHYNWRGLAEASSWTDGSPADVELGGSTKIAWPAGQGVYMRRAPPPGGSPVPTWIGSLPENGQTGAGQLYRRNRYYDPASGRFTQEDPIGLAGGLNLYGFAGGDPVNFSDPFGLCPRVTYGFNQQTGKYDLTMALNLAISGGSPADATAVGSAIQKHWAGVRGIYNVTVNLGDASAPTYDVTIKQVSSSTVPSTGWSRGPGRGGVMNMNFFGSSASAGNMRLTAHEFGHASGLGYHQTGNSIMNSPPGTSTDPATIGKIIAKCDGQRIDDEEEDEKDEDDGKDEPRQ
jgi:RHS repeat-associated protein